MTQQPPPRDQPWAPGPPPYPPGSTRPSYQAGPVNQTGQPPYPYASGPAPTGNPWPLPGTTLPGGPPPGAQPLGVPAPPRVSIEEFEAPRRTAPLILIGALVIAFVVGGLGIWAAGRGFTPGSTPAPSAPATAQPSATRSGGVAFETADHSTGYWRITDTRWGSGTVTLRVSVTVDKGTLAYTFYAFDNVSANVYDPATSAPSPAFPRSGKIQTGQTVDGYLVFPITSRADGTLILSDTAGRTQIAGLGFKG